MKETDGLEPSKEVLSGVFSFLDQPMLIEELADEYDAPLDRLLRKLRGVAVIVWRKLGMHGCGHPDFSSLQDATADGCTLIPAMRLSPFLAPLLEEYESTIDSQLKLIPKMAVITPKLSVMPDPVSDEAIIALNKAACGYLAVYIDAKCNLRPTQVDVFEAAVRNHVFAVTSCTRTKTDSGPLPADALLVVGEFLDAAETAFGPAPLRAELKTLVQDQSMVDKNSNLFVALHAQCCSFCTGVEAFGKIELDGVFALKSKALACDEVLLPAHQTSWISSVQKALSVLVTWLIGEENTKEDTLMGGKFDSTSIEYIAGFSSVVHILKKLIPTEADDDDLWERFGMTEQMHPDIKIIFNYTNLGDSVEERYTADGRGAHRKEFVVASERFNEAAFLGVFFLSIIWTSNVWA